METMGLGMEWKPKPVNPSLVRSSRAAATSEIPSISAASSTKTQPISVSSRGGLDGGHYSAHAKLVDENRWHHFDDNHVSPVGEREIKT
ncbi:hypothetical protein VitviT2T_002791 [Vitis vinifera]|uniref:USP domain-containing protein n=1 Tax=Vitis vinifera TaxID=29760 RepID=A0ABY9BKZ4_VITVI|nr:hypothetical protein VitviT2T_002791 [Vitis vinifera]